MVGAIPYRESDLIVTAISPERGKIGMICRANRKGNKGASRIDLMDQGSFRLGPQRGELYSLREFSPCAPSYRGLSSLDSLSLAMSLCEVCAAFCLEDDDQAQRYFDALKNGLDQIYAAQELKLKCRALF